MNYEEMEQYIYGILGLDLLTNCYAGKLMDLWIKIYIQEIYHTV